MHSPVIEKETREKPFGQSEKVVAAELVKYKQFGTNGQYFPHEIKQFSNATSVTDFVESSVTNGTFTHDTRYQLQAKNEQYDAHGNLTLSYDANDTPTSLVWAYNNALPIAQIRNASPSQAAAFVFDDNRTSGWAGANGTWSITNGEYRQTDASNTTVWTLPKRYDNLIFDDAILEAEVRIDDAGIPRFATIYKFIDSNNFTRFELRRTASGNYVRIHARKNAVDVNFEVPKSLNANQWYRLRGEIQGSTAKLYLDGELLVTWTDANVDLTAGKIGLGTWASIASFDNVRFYPLNALATSVSFDPGFFKINAKTDESGISTVFTYDALARLSEIRDRANNLIKDFDYFYSSPFSATNPNYIEEKTYRDVTQLTTNRNWYDGLGRAVQAQQNLGTGSIKVGTVYDALNRPVKVTKPFSSTAQTFTTGDPITAANSDYSNRTAYYPSYNPDTSPYAYSETESYA